MASTPSASALSAVLRCRGNILARKRANKTRPAASVCGLGMKSSDRSYFRALQGYLLHWEKQEIPGVLSVSTQFKTPCSRQSDTNSLVSKNPRTFCVSIVCASSENTLNSNETDSFPLGLLSILKNRLMCLTSAVSHIVRMKLGIDRTNQMDPDCDKMSGCVQCSTEDHMQAESETCWQEDASEPEE